MPAPSLPHPPLSPAPLAPPALSGAPQPAAACPGVPRPARPDIIDWAGLPPLDAWALLVARIREADAPQVAAALAELGLVSLASGEIRVACNQRFAREHFSSQLRAETEELAHLYLGAPFKVVVIEGEPSLPGCPSLALLERQRQEEAQAQAVAEARAHPSIQALVGAFQAELRHIRPHVAR